jgi:DNA-binding transcriptional ArsR family regulator
MPNRSASIALSQTDREALRRFKADVFQVLAHPTRIHVIECLRDRERSVGEILGIVGVEPANLSQHLAVLRSKHLVETRKDGNLVYYSLRDALLVDVLDAMRKYFLKYLEESLAMLRGFEREP